VSFYFKFIRLRNFSKDSSFCVGAESLGYPGIAHGMFPKGGFELVNHFYQQSNMQLASELEEEVKLGS